MMISPESYIEELKEKSFEALIDERSRLIKEIEELEKIVFDKSTDSEEWNMDPGPDVIYQEDLQYLAELCKFLGEKYGEWSCND